MPHRAPPTLDPLPSSIKEAKPKPAIPASHLNPKSSTVSVEEETQPIPEIVEEIIEEPTPEPVEKDSTPIEIEDNKPTPEEGPAVAVGKIRGLGLRQKPQEKEPELTDGSDEERVSDLIAESKALASDSGMAVEGKDSPSQAPISKAAEAARTTLAEAVSASDKAFEKRSKMIAKKRKTRATAAPSKRVVKLNRRKYMEFKVDVREIMEEENVDEEHRANLLGSTWAKGERQGINAAIEFVEQKLEDQIISDGTAERIIKVLKGYRKVR